MDLRLRVDVTPLDDGTFRVECAALHLTGFARTVEDAVRRAPSMIRLCLGSHLDVGTLH